jgi:hypothetical protein
LQFAEQFAIQQQLQLEVARLRDQLRNMERQQEEEQREREREREQQQQQQQLVSQAQESPAAFKAISWLRGPLPFFLLTTRLASAAFRALACHAVAETVAESVRAQTRSDVMGEGAIVAARVEYADREELIAKAAKAKWRRKSLQVELDSLKLHMLSRGRSAGDDAGADGGGVATQRRRTSIYELPSLKAALQHAATQAAANDREGSGGGAGGGGAVRAGPLDHVLMSAEETEEAAREAFTAYDVDSSGDLDYNELVSLVTEMFHAGVADDSVRDWCMSVFEQMDPDGNGVLDFDEYVQVHNMAVKRWANGTQDEMSDSDDI